MVSEPSVPEVVVEPSLPTEDVGIDGLLLLSESGDDGGLLLLLLLPPMVGAGIKGLGMFDDVACLLSILDEGRFCPLVSSDTALFTVDSALLPSEFLEELVVPLLLLEFLTTSPPEVVEEEEVPAPEDETMNGIDKK
jgi:hypothetical protein